MNNNDSNNNDSNNNDSNKNRVLNIKICKCDPCKLNYISFKSKLNKSKKPISQSLPIKIDFRTNPKMSPIRDQGNIGSCTAFALGICVEFVSDYNFRSSPLFLYYTERFIEGTIFEDSGAYLHDGVKCLQNYGVCSERLWPYITSKFTIKPTQVCYTDASNHQALQVRNIQQDVISMKSCLASGTPFVCGIRIYSSFMTRAVAISGTVPMPNIQREKMLGGHAISIVGYDDSDSKNKYWICRNSWGTRWGNKGYFRIPQAYLLSKFLTTDLWCIIKMESHLC
jgi:C1A family cysteine protease